MSTNDLVLLDQLLDQRLADVGAGISEAEYFEIFSAEQVTKDDNLSYDEIVNGIVDGEHDGGIDSIYFFINNSLYTEDLDLTTCKRNVLLRLVMIQSKIKKGFSESGIEKFISSTTDLFDLTKNIETLNSVYNNGVIRNITYFRETYLALASKFPAVSFQYVYASKATEPHKNVERKVNRLKNTIESYINPVDFSFRFLGASELLLQARKSPSRISSLTLTENPISTGEEGFVCLVSIKNYKKFITDDDSHLRSYLFEGNVRDYQGKTEVNKEIKATLDAGGNEDFWWLNNGVSIICSKASLSGKTLTIEDVEIVNGLQTSREIFEATNHKDLTNEARNILVRVLKPKDEASRDRIIKATNSQTPIPLSSLRATDKIHRDIEEYLYPLGYFYDRRKNYYKNIGKQLKKILSIPFVAQSVMASVILEPGHARARPSSLLKNDVDYKRIFNVNYPLHIFYVCPLLVKSIEDRLYSGTMSEMRSHANNIRFYVAMLSALRLTNSKRPCPEKVAQIKIDDLTEVFLDTAINDVMKIFQELGATDQVAKGADFKNKVLELLG